MAAKRILSVPLLLTVLDVVSVAAIFNVVFYLRGVSDGPFAIALAAPVIVFAVALHLIDGYGARVDMMNLDYASVHLIASFFACLTTVFLTFVFIPAGFQLQGSRGAIFLSFVLLGPLTLAYRRTLYSKSVAAIGSRSLVFVGDLANFHSFSAECQRMGTRSPIVHVDSDENYRSFESILGSIAKSEIQVEAIVVKESGKDLPRDVPLKLVQLYFEGTPTYTLEVFQQVYWRKIPLYRINPIWLFQEGFRIAREPVFERIKRASDIVCSILGLVVSFPVVVAAAAAIKMDDGGEVFFSQTRIGRYGVPFRLLKLRTMRSTDSQADPYTRKGDARITRVGKMLRSARMDELPQLWNVLRGEMSLIGPRAEWDRLVVEYERDIPSYHFRHLVKPGITGWAQVNYRYGLGMEDTLRKLEYDLYYIRNFSFMLDASIVLKTFHVMILRKGH